MMEQHLQEIEARAAAASPAPWAPDPERHSSEDWIVSGVEVLRAADGEFVAEVGYPDLPAREAKMAFILASREDVSALLGEVRRLREALAAVGHWALAHMEGGLYRRVVAVLDPGEAAPDARSRQGGEETT